MDFEVPSFDEKVKNHYLILLVHITCSHVSETSDVQEVQHELHERANHLSTASREGLQLAMQRTTEWDVPINTGAWGAGSSSGTPGRQNGLQQQYLLTGTFGIPLNKPQIITLEISHMTDPKTSARDSRLTIWPATSTSINWDP